MINFLKGVSLQGLSAVASYFSAFIFVQFYADIFSVTLGGGLFLIYSALAEYLLGFIIAYSFFLPLIFESFGLNGKYWWIGILLLPLATFVIWGDLSHAWFYVLVAIAGWTIGFGIQKLISLVRNRSHT